MDGSIAAAGLASDVGRAMRLLLLGASWEWRVAADTLRVGTGLGSALLQ
jgi:hypothetical protein